MTVRTYDPQNMILVCSVVPLLEWTSLAYAPSQSTTLLKGLDKNPTVLTLRGGDQSVLLLDIDYTSPLNQALHGVQVLNEPFPCAIYDANSAVNEQGLGGQGLFMWPCVFAGKPTRGYARGAEVFRWTILGITRFDNMGGVYD